jgi:hypothetical protein
MVISIAAYESNEIEEILGDGKKIAPGCRKVHTPACTELVRKNVLEILQKKGLVYRLNEAHPSVHNTNLIGLIDLILRGKPLPFDSNEVIQIIDQFSYEMMAETGDTIDFTKIFASKRLKKMCPDSLDEKSNDDELVDQGISQDSFYSFLSLTTEEAEALEKEAGILRIPGSGEMIKV